MEKFADPDPTDCAPIGTSRRIATIDDSTPYVGSGKTRLPSPGGEPEPTDAERLAVAQARARAGYPPSGTGILTLQDLTWSCHVCGRTRPDERIHVFTRDVEAPGLPAGTFRVNVRFCADQLECRHEAPAVADRWVRSIEHPRLDAYESVLDR